MKNIMVIFVLAVIIGSAIAYIVKAKKSGVKCIGCPSAKSCKQYSCRCNTEE